MVYTLKQAPGGWVISGGLTDVPLIFLSGAKAEAKVKQLAALSVRLGAWALVRVIMADGSVLRELRYGPTPIAA